MDEPETSEIAQPDESEPDAKDWFERWLDAHFEGPFFAMRYVTLVPVLFAFLGAILMFIIGAIESWEAVSELTHELYSHSGQVELVEQPEHAEHAEHTEPTGPAKHADQTRLARHSSAVPSAVETKLIRAIDAFLLGLVMMIFSYGIYDLFVSELDPADAAGVRPDWLKFHNISELKTTLAHVVLIILVITFFEMVLEFDDKFTEVWSLLVIPGGVLLIGLGLAIFEKGTARHDPITETSQPKHPPKSDSSS